MRTIFKYPLTVTDQQKVEMPVEACIRAIQVQDGIPCIWAEVNTENGMESRTFETFGTGQPIPGCASGGFRSYLGTYQIHGGRLIFHIYELFRSVK